MNLAVRIVALAGAETVHSVSSPEPPVPGPITIPRVSQPAVH